MKQIKEDTEKNKQAEQQQSKEIAQLRKEQLNKEGLIQTCFFNYPQICNFFLL